MTRCQWLGVNVASGPVGPSGSAPLGPVIYMGFRLAGLPGSAADWLGASPEHVCSTWLGCPWLGWSAWPIYINGFQAGACVVLHGSGGPPGSPMACSINGSVFVPPVGLGGPLGPVYTLGYTARIEQ